jgi:hypothetical protein
MSKANGTNGSNGWREEEATEALRNFATYRGEITTTGRVKLTKEEEKIYQLAVKLARDAQDLEAHEEVLDLWRDAMIGSIGRR